MGTSGSSPGALQEDAQEIFYQLDEPGTPLSTAEFATRLECTLETARAVLSTLRDRDEIEAKDLDEETTLWWRPQSVRSVPDQGVEQVEFDAFARSVEEYAVFTLDTDGTVISWNDGARQTTGFAEEEIIGEHVSTFHTEEEVESGEPRDILEQAANANRTEHEGWRTHKDGTEFWANETVTAIRDNEGTLQGFTTVMRDMTTEREYEHKLEQESKQTEKLLRTAPVAIAVQDATGKTVLANQRAQDALGLSEEEFIKSPQNPEQWGLFKPSGEPIPDHETPTARAMTTGSSVYDEEVIIDPPNDNRMYFRVNAAPIFDDDGNIERVITAGEDISELKAREQQLKERKAELETELSEILGRISDAFYALDDEWRFTHYNERAAEIFDTSQDTLIGESIWERFPEVTDGEIYDRFHTAMETQEAATFEHYVDDLRAWLEINAYPSDSGLSVYFHDITERKRYEQQLEESNERLEQFAYAASHDLQEPLRMVSSYLQLIERRYADSLDEDGKEFLEFAVDGADRMRDMIESLLKYSRVDTRGDPLEPTELDAVLEEVRTDLGMRLEETDATLTVESLPRVYGDGSQLRQVFQNLLDNAITYSGESAPKIHVSAERTNGKWTLAVEDDGIGFDPDDADRVFQVFERLHPPDTHPGTGIGLALCERIIERHGGDIWVETEPEAGATFYLTLTPAGDDP